MFREEKQQISQDNPLLCPAPSSTPIHLNQPPFTFICLHIPKYTIQLYPPPSSFIHFPSAPIPPAIYYTSRQFPFVTPLIPATPTTPRLPPFLAHFPVPFPAPCSAPSPATK